jgi:tetratricopeptide (TPR) repeat protein
MNTMTAVYFSFLCLFLGLIAAPQARTSPLTLDDAIQLQREGKNQEALKALGELLPELRASPDRSPLARALSSMTDAWMALGDYRAAIRHGQEAFTVRQQLGQQSQAAWDLNAVGLAHFYLGEYEPALTSYRNALTLDRAASDGDGEATRLNNIGNVHYMRGRYADALKEYEDALATVDARTTDRARPRLRKMTLSNLAALFQRLGNSERALDLYSRLRTAGTMQPAEEAQLLVNEGALFRRLGDPVKALDAYGRAQRAFASASHRDGEIGAWRNIGIAYALDFKDDERALRAFDEALRLSRSSANVRGEVQARLYRGETLRRRGQLKAAAAELETARAGATASGLIEEQWKTHYSIGRVFEREGRIDQARRSFEQALAAIESVRTDLRTAALRSEFLADKRDVYDALISLRLSERDVALEDVFQLMERSRARTWQDRLQLEAAPLTLRDVQAKIAPGTLLLEYWSGSSGSALLWITSSESRIVSRTGGGDDAATIQRLIDSVQGSGEEWRAPAAAAGRILLTGLPNLRPFTRLQIVPDGQLHFVPFETLVIPDSNDLLLERVAISYLPSAALLFRAEPRSQARWTWPWQRSLVAFGDPAPAPNDPIRSGDPMPRLPFAEEEVRGIAGLVPGRAEVYFGAAAEKLRVVERGRDVALLHFSTHAVADMRDPDRSRIRLASTGSGAPEYLFLREIYDLDLKGVQLVTLSACSTERGTVIRGEGVEGFGRALVAAGAGAAVTTMWDVADRASAEFMKQFYFALASGRSEAAALQWAKLQFVHSPLAWSHPRYWAGYVLTGDGSGHLSPGVPWSLLVGVPALLACVAAALYLRRTTRS